MYRVVSSKGKFSAARSGKVAGEKEGGANFYLVLFD